jgi:hypothetical protein
MWFTEFDVYFRATEVEDRKLCKGNEIKNQNMENSNNKIATYHSTDRVALKANILGLLTFQNAHNNYLTVKKVFCIVLKITLLTEFGQYVVS